MNVSRAYGHRRSTELALPLLCGRSVLRTVIPESLSSPPSPFTLLHDARTEPWGQTVARLQSSEGAIIGISYAPSMH